MNISFPIVPNQLFSGRMKNNRHFGYPKTKITDFKISGTHLGTTLHHCRLILETEKEPGTKSRFHYLCPQALSVLYPGFTQTIFTILIIFSCRPKEGVIIEYPLNGLFHDPRDLILTSQVAVSILFYFFPLVRRLFIWSPSMVYILVIITHILHITNHAGPNIKDCELWCKLENKGHLMPIHKKITTTTKPPTSTGLNQCCFTFLFREMLST